MKTINKIIIATTIIFMSLFSITNQTYKVQAASAGDIITQAEGFVNQGEQANASDPAIDKGKLEEGANLMYDIALAIGSFIAIIVGIIVGIKFMTAATADEKAQFKKTLIVYIVGCVVIFGAMGIWRLVIITVNGVTSDGVAQPTTQTAPSTQPAKQKTEEEQLEEFLNNLTPAQESQVRNRAIQKMKENGMNTNPSSGATSVPNSQTVNIPDSYYKEAAKEIMKGK